MEKERKIKVLTIVALIVSVLCLTVAFAALSQNLTINNFAGIYQDVWDIRIQGDDNYYEKGNARTQNFQYFNEGGNPSNGTLTLDVGENFNTLSGFNFTFKKPGDFASIDFFIANYGNVDAELSKIVNNELVCTSSIGNEEDAKLVCDNLIIKYGYEARVSADGSISVDELNIGDDLLASQSEYSTDIVTKPVVIVIYLDPSLDKLPSSDVTVSNLGFKLIYTQKD